jgi:epidermal growth factor receptor substrate 15
VGDGIQTNQVWCRDLSDLNKDGKLTRDGFAVAMHLINGKLAGREIPAELPLSLIPPSFRTNGAQAPAPAAPTHSEFSMCLFRVNC